MHIKQERKYEARDGKLWNRASGEAIPDDEPVFVFRARDVKAIGALLRYLEICVEAELEHDHIEAVRGRLSDFQAFRQNHPDRMKVPDTVRS